MVGVPGAGDFIATMIASEAFFNFDEVFWHFLIRFL